MKRARSERNQPCSRPRFPKNITIRSQTGFRSHNESVDNSVIRNNNQQLSYREDQVRPGSLSSFEASGGQFRPRSAGLIQHQTVRPTAMNGFASSRHFMSYPTARLFRPHFRGAFNNYARFNSPRIPSNMHQFQEAQATQGQWNARYVQRNFGHTNTITSTNGIQDKGHKAKGYLDKNTVSMRRKWQAMSEVDQCRPNEFTFSLVTYNLLSDSLLFENMFLYEECDQDYLNWGYRKEKLLAELLGYDAEILCLQEVDAYHYENWFVPKLQEAGYTGLFTRRTGGKPDGCAIFYRHVKFTLVKHKLVRYYTPEVQILDKDNVGVILLLKANTADHEVDNQFICVANTHLLFNKKRGDIKLAQLCYLFAEIHELAVLSQDDRRKTHCPIILCGDLNSLPFSPLYHFLVTGQLEYNTRSPAVISGQLTPSQTRRGPSSRRVRTPLLPWEFGITADCQWREERESKSDTEWRSKRHSNDPSQRCEPGSSTQRVSMSTFPDYPPTPNPTQYVEVKDSSHPNLDRRDRSKEFGEQQGKTEHTSQEGYFNNERKLKDTEQNRRCAREVPAFDRYIEQEEDFVQTNCFKDTQGNLTREPDRKTARQMENNLEVIDLTREMGSPFPHDGAPELNTNSKSNRFFKGENGLLKGTKSNQMREANWKAGKSEKTYDIVDLTKDIESPTPCNRVAELNKNSKSNTLSVRESDFGRECTQLSAAGQTGYTAGKTDRTTKVIDLTGGTERNMESFSICHRTVDASKVGSSNIDPDLKRSNSLISNRMDEPHPENLPSPTTLSRDTDLQTEKTNYDNNGTISIPWKFKSVYTHRSPDGTPEVTTCHSKACCNVDYIFYTDRMRQKRSAADKQYVQTGKLTLLGRLKLMGKTDFDAMNLLPNHIFPSDHLSLQARFKLT